MTTVGHHLPSTAPVLRPRNGSPRHRPGSRHGRTVASTGDRWRSSNRVPRRSCPTRSAGATTRWREDARLVRATGETGSVRWDDPWLLRLIDELESSDQAGHLQNGLQLLRQAAGVLKHQIDWNRDLWPFARELLLAHEAGLLTWRDMTARTVGGVDPKSNTQY